MVYCSKYISCSYWFQCGVLGCWMTFLILLQPLRLFLTCGSIILEISEFLAEYSKASWQVEKENEAGESQKTFLEVLSRSGTLFLLHWTTSVMGSFRCKRDTRKCTTWQRKLVHNNTLIQWKGSISLLLIASHLCLNKSLCFCCFVCSFPEAPELRYKSGKCG